MQNDWMIHVLKDLRAFAEMNGMDELAGKLGEAAILAKNAMIDMSAVSVAGQITHAVTAGDGD